MSFPGMRLLHMRLILRCATIVACAALPGALSVAAQYPVQSSKGNQNTPEVRAVGVLEWTGDQDHPKASRLIPVSVYDGAELQDGGIYLARPAPLALSSEVEYELKDNGKTVGFFDINNAGQVQGSWVGFGVWKPLPKPKPHASAASIWLSPIIIWLTPTMCYPTRSRFSIPTSPAALILKNPCAARLSRSSLRRRCSNATTLRACAKKFCPVF